MENYAGITVITQYSSKPNDIVYPAEDGGKGVYSPSTQTLRIYDAKNILIKTVDTNRSAVPKLNAKS